jgi:hypothetical protein
LKRLYRTEDIALRPASEADDEFLYELLRERYATEFANIVGMASPELPTFAEHCAYLARRPYARLEIVTSRDDPSLRLGMMYLTHDHVGGCFVLQRFSRRGVALAACHAFFLTCEYPVTAHFNPANRAGWRAADRTGWTLVESLPHRLTYELRQPPTDPFAHLPPDRGAERPGTGDSGA